MYFAAQFREATGLRPHDYVIRRRISLAKELLAGSDRSIVDTALSVGFQTQAHFTTVFKRVEGSTPHRWRELNQEIGREAMTTGSRVARTTVTITATKCTGSHRR
jgi:AraC-like DNA-binding protein